MEQVAAHLFDTWCIYTAGASLAITSMLLIVSLASPIISQVRRFGASELRGSGDLPSRCHADTSDAGLSIICCPTKMLVVAVQVKTLIQAPELQDLIQRETEALQAL